MDNDAVEVRLEDDVPPPPEVPGSEKLGKNHENKTSKNQDPLSAKKAAMSGLTQKEKDLDEVKVMDWNEFTQHTTFHGIKYIFEESPFRLRR